MNKFKTTVAYVSGGIVGQMWLPPTLGGKPFQGDIRQQIRRYSVSKGITFRDVLLSMLTEHGGDFQNPQFSADTVLRIERRAIDSPGQYRVHVWEREVSAIKSL